MIRWLKKRKDQPVEESLETPQKQPLPESEENGQKAFFFVKKLKERLSHTRKAISNGLDRILAGKKRIDGEVLEDLEELLITSDIGVQTTMELIERVSNESSKIADAEQLKTVLKNEILSLIHVQSDVERIAPSSPRVIMVVGVNGVGKTTTIGKLAAKASGSGKKVLIAAADTFRAAAIEQLVIWAERAGSEIVKHRDNADPAAVVYDSIEAAIARGSDIVLVDTAGRLHTKVNLMEELKKIKRTISKKLPGAPHEIILILDATTGQNAFSQAKLFNDALGVTGIVITKLDGTAKGGIVVNICSSLKIPLKYIGIGEKIEDLEKFDAVQFVNALF